MAENQSVTSIGFRDQMKIIGIFAVFAFAADFSLGTYPTLVEGPLGMTWLWSPGVAILSLPVLVLLVLYVTGRLELGD